MFGCVLPLDSCRIELLQYKCATQRCRVALQTLVTKNKFRIKEIKELICSLEFQNYKLQTTNCYCPCAKE